MDDHSVDAFAPGFAPDQIHLEMDLWEGMLAHIRACLPEEACGLVGGRYAGRLALAEWMLPIENELHSPTRFRMNPAEQLQAFYQLEQRGLELVGIFHSHPAGPPLPSPTDVAEFAYPGTLVLIWAPEAGARAGWNLRGFSIETGKISEVLVLQNGIKS